MFKKVSKKEKPMPMANEMPMGNTMSPEMMMAKGQAMIAKGKAMIAKAKMM